MRICLYWNGTAGGGISLDRVKEVLTRGGHQIVRIVEEESALREAAGDVDCVAAAGGDGTIARAGRALTGTTVPLAILPMGTANNIARSLGIGGDVTQMVKRWHERQVAKIDVGSVACGRNTGLFVESVGSGLVASCIEEGRATLSKDDPDMHLEDAVALYVNSVGAAPLRHHSIKLDDEEISGDFFLVEILNTPSIGPQLEFAADANAADGFFSVVAAGEADRDAVRNYLTSASRSPGNAGLRSWRARRVAISGADRIHIDDRVAAAGGSTIRIAMRSAALSILA